MFGGRLVRYHNTLTDILCLRFIARACNASNDSLLTAFGQAASPRSSLFLLSLSHDQS